MAHVPEAEIQYQPAQQHGTSRRGIGAGRARLDDPRNGAVSRSGDGTPFGSGQEPRPAIEPDTLRRGREVRGGGAELRMGPCRHHPATGAAEMVHDRIAGMRIEQPGAEGIAAQPGRPVPCRNRSPKPFPPARP
jgi:hypothetical protein